MPDLMVDDTCRPPLIWNSQVIRNPQAHAGDGCVNPCSDRQVPWP